MDVDANTSVNFVNRTLAQCCHALGSAQITSLGSDIV